MREQILSVRDALRHYFMSCIFCAVRRSHSHVGEHGVVAGDLGEVGFQDGHCAGESHVSTATEEGDAGEAQDGGHQWGVRHAAETFDAALEATCPGWRGQRSVRSFDIMKHGFTVWSGVPDLLTPQGHISPPCVNISPESIYGTVSLRYLEHL